MPDVRLIDGNAIVEKLKSYYEALSPDVQSELIRRDEVSSCIAELINAPTIDAQPEKHGKWKRDASGELNCSTCGYVPKWDDDKFCANCGAKMDGDADETT